jgi:hypothetical protein
MMRSTACGPLLQERRQGGNDLRSRLQNGTYKLAKSSGRKTVLPASKKTGSGRHGVDGSVSLLGDLPKAGQVLAGLDVSLYGITGVGCNEHFPE